MQDVTGNDLWGLNLDELTITENSSLESESLLQFGNDRAGLIFLNETDSGVKQQQSANDTEVDPVLKTSSKNGCSLCGVKAFVSSIARR